MWCSQSAPGVRRARNSGTLLGSTDRRYGRNRAYSSRRAARVEPAREFAPFVAEARGRACRRDREATGTTRLAHPRDAGRRSRAGHEARRAGFPSPLSLLASWAWRAATLAAVPGRGSPRLPGHGTPDSFLRKDILFTAFSVIVSSPCPKFPPRNTCFYSRSRPWPKGKAVPVARRRA